MKKVLALVLAVMMLATVAFARPVADITPGSTIKIDKEAIKDSGNVTVTALDDTKTNIPTAAANSSDAILRSITTENYAIANIKYAKVGKSLVKGVTINDKDERIEVKLVDDLDNQTAKDFEVSFKLKGKAKFTVKDTTEANTFMTYTGATNVIPGDKVTLPDVYFTVSGSVGYGKVEVSVGTEGDEEIEGLQGLTTGVKAGDPVTTSTAINRQNDVIKFVRSTTVPAGNATRVAGAYTADAILTEEYGDALTLEARVYHNDVLYFGIDYAPDRDIIGRLADSDADMDFYSFNSNTKFTTFNSNAKLYFNDAEEDDFVYQVKDQKLVPVGSYSEDDGCWVVKTRTLGTYVVSDVELKEFEGGSGDVSNPDTGANDVVGIAAALAAVALVSAAAVSLKK